MQKTYCDDCGNEIPVGQGILSGQIKLGHAGKEAYIKLQFKNSLGNDPDLCPDCAVSLVEMLRQYVLSPKPKVVFADCRCESFYGRADKHAVGCPVGKKVEAEKKLQEQAAEMADGDPVAEEFARQTLLAAQPGDDMEAAERRVLQAHPGQYSLKYHVACVACDWLGYPYDIDSLARKALSNGSSECPDCEAKLRIKRVLRPGPEAVEPKPVQEKLEPKA